MGNIVTTVRNSFSNAGISWNNEDKEPTDTAEDKTENNQTSLGNPVTKMVNQIRRSFKQGHGISWEGGRGHIQTTEELVEAFREVGPALIRRLYKIYKYDFELFGYSPEKYLNISK